MAIEMFISDNCTVKKSIKTGFEVCILHVPYTESGSQIPLVLEQITLVWVSSFVWNQQAGRRRTSALLSVLLSLVALDLTSDCSLSLRQLM